MELNINELRGVFGTAG